MLNDQIIQGDVLETLQSMPDECVDCIITSPPYYGLRDYGVEGQLGLEPTLAEFLDRMLLITAELKRVLKKTGTMWWNHGDSYAGSGKGYGDKSADPKFKSVLRGGGGSRSRTLRPERSEMPAKSLMLHAHRLQNQIIWHKPNVMPASVQDRFTVDFEPIFMFSKAKRYFFEKQLEPSKDGTYKPFNIRVPDADVGKSAQYRASEDEKRKYAEKHEYGPGGTGLKGHSGNLRPDGTYIGTPGKRGMRAVWKIATKSFKEAHFATFPEALLETPMRAGCPEFVCSKCGKPRQKIIRNGARILGSHSRAAVGKHEDMETAGAASYREKSPMVPNARYEKILEGYTDCGCGAEWQGGVCLDPFMGAGTTAVVAKKFNRHYLGIELNPEYIRIAESRLNDLQLPLL